MSISVNLAKKGKRCVGLAAAQEGMTAPVVGAMKVSHVEEAVGVPSVKLPLEEIAQLGEPCVLHPVFGQ